MNLVLMPYYYFFRFFSFTDFQLLLESGASLQLLNFGPIPFQSGHFGLGRFGPISGVNRFGTVAVGRFGPIS